MNALAPGVASSGRSANGDGTPEALRRVMRRHAAGVTVITSRDPEGRPVGFCATSLASVSLRPPVVSFNVALGSSSGAAWRAAESVGIVHLLRADQASVAATFAVPGPAKFTGPGLCRGGPADLPMLPEVSGWLLVRARDRLVVGDHLLVVAEVRQAWSAPDAPPLVHHDGAFRTLARDRCDDRVAG